MAFVLSEEQQMLRDSARAFADEKLPVSQLRALRAKGEGFDKAAWKEMAELGFAGVLIPEEFGGSGFGYVGLGQVSFCFWLPARTSADAPTRAVERSGEAAMVRPCASSTWPRPT